MDARLALAAASWFGKEQGHIDHATGRVYGQVHQGVLRGARGSTHQHGDGREGSRPGEPGHAEGRRLDELRLFQEGITVLGIHRADGTYLGVPRGETTIRARERLVLYGCDERLRGLEGRRSGPSGAETHRQAVADHEHLRQVQGRDDEARGRDEVGGRTLP